MATLSPPIAPAWRDQPLDQWLVHTGNGKVLSMHEPQPVIPAPTLETEERAMCGDTCNGDWVDLPSLRDVPVPELCNVAAKPRNVRAVPRHLLGEPHAFSKPLVAQHSVERPDLCMRRDAVGAAVR